MFYELSTNKHALLSNIELRKMSEGTNSDAGLRIVENEVGLEEGGKLGGYDQIEGITTVMLTDVMPNGNDVLEKEVLESGTINQSLPMGSFPSLSSEQNSKGEEDDPIVPTTNRVKILRFEDTLSKEDCRQFKIIYESVLLEGRAGNLTKSTLEVVLAQKPPTWLQVMYERLKHLIISSETFQNRMKTGYGLRIETKLDGKSKLLGNERQEGFQTRNSSHSQLKDKSTNNSTLGIIDDQFCWQIGVLIVEFWLVYSVLNSS